MFRMRYGGPGHRNRVRVGGERWLQRLYPLQLP